MVRGPPDGLRQQGVLPALEGPDDAAGAGRRAADRARRAGHVNFVMIALYFKYILLPQLPRGSLIVCDNGSYWSLKCAAPSRRRRCHRLGSTLSRRTPRAW